MRFLPRFSAVQLLVSLLIVSPPTRAQERSQTLDDQVEQFLEKHQSDWEDMNIPAKDGRFLYDLIIQNKHTRALEIGTSTGHSAIWIAWALSKTGGRLTTIEIDEKRHAKATENFQEAGLAEYINAHCGDAHDLVRQLAGPFDFVFSDADKDWNKQYFIDLAPKMTVGGCFITHNVSMRQGEYRGSTKEYVDFLKSQKNFDTSVENNSSTGMSVSCKRAK